MLKYENELLVDCRRAACNKRVAQDNTNAVSPAVDRAAARAAAPATAPATGDCGAGGQTESRQTQETQGRRRPSRPLTEPTVTLVPGPAEVAVNNSMSAARPASRAKSSPIFKKGDTVTVLEQINLDKHKANEPAQWAKIAYPVERPRLGQRQIH